MRVFGGRKLGDEASVLPVEVDEDEGGQHEDAGEAVAPERGRGACTRDNNGDR